jgi:hypothetical protein
MTLRSVLIVGGITVAHAALSFLLFMAAFGASMGRFDSGEAATAGERILDFVAEILLWPLFAPLTHWGGRSVDAVFPGVLGYIPLLLNSLLWAFAIVLAWRWLRGRRAAGA